MDAEVSSPLLGHGLQLGAELGGNSALCHCVSLYSTARLKQYICHLAGHVCLNQCWQTARRSRALLERSSGALRASQNLEHGTRVLRLGSGNMKRQLHRWPHCARLVTITPNDFLTFFTVFLLGGAYCLLSNFIARLKLSCSVLRRALRS